jgi:transposase
MVHGYGTPPSRTAVKLVAAKVGCTTATLRGWMHQAERRAAERAALTADEHRRMKELERENRELKRTNDLLRKATAFFAHAVLDRRPKGA